MNAILANWKTSLLGVSTLGLLVFGAIKAVLDGDPSTIIDVNLLSVGIPAAIAMILGRDADKSSESSGAK